MEDFNEAGYEETVKTQKRQRPKSRGKTEKKKINYKLNVFGSFENKKQSTKKNLFLQKNYDYPRKMTTENNIKLNPLKIFSNNHLNKSPNIVSSSIPDEEISDISNEIDNKNNNSHNKFNLIFSKKSSINTNDSDSKILSFTDNIKKHKKSQTSKFPNFDFNSPKEMTIINFDRIKNLKNQNVLISPKNLYKSILYDNNFSNENKIKLNNKKNNTSNNLYDVKRIINSLEKVNLTKLHKRKQNSIFSDEEENKEEDEEESDTDDIKIQYGYVSSSSTERERERKIKENKRYLNTQFINKREGSNSLVYNKNNVKVYIQSHQKYRRSTLKENDIKINPFKENSKENNRTKRKSITYVKNYKKFYEDMKALQKNNINIKDFFKQTNNIFTSSAFTLMKELNGEKCLNEDSYLIKENIFGKNFNIYGVFDGHGKDGDKISKNIAENMSKFFSSKKNYQTFLDIFEKNTFEIIRKNFENKPDQKGENEISLNLSKIKKIFTEDNYYFIKRSVKYCEYKLKNKELNLKFSGSTCVMLFLFNDQLICSNIGNSRCVLFKCTQNDRWSYINLSTEHLPLNEEEKKRIRKKGGEIHPLIDENGNYDDDIQRIWVKNKPYPGLAISRSIGDYIGKKIGIISVPTFICKKIDDRSKFIILGSDGFWDVMDYYEIINIVKPFLNSGNPEKASKILVEKAKKNWKKIGERDDITVIVIFIFSDLTSKYETNMNLDSNVNISVKI